MTDQQPGRDQSENPKLDPSWRRVIADFVNALAESNKSKQATQKAQDRAANRTALSTIFIAGFTFVSVVVSVAMWIIANRTLNELRDEQRPWMAESKIGWTNAADPTANLSVTYELTNSGKSPAENLETASTNYHRPIPKTDTINWNTLDVWKESIFSLESICSQIKGNRYAVAFPGVQPPLITTIPGAEFIKEAGPVIKSGDEFFIFTQCAFYRSAGVVYRTTFCAFAIPPIVGNTFKACPVGNLDHKD